MKKIRVGVLMGGMSIEKEVSFNSGRTICDHLDSSLYDIIPLFQTTNNQLFILPWRFLHRGKISDFEERLSAEADEIKWDDLKTKIDFIYIAVHGRFAEDGTVQGLLEVLNIPYLGAKVFGSAIGMDKIKQKKWLSLAGLTVPNGIHLSPHEFQTITSKDILKKLKIKNIKLPVIIKPNKEGSSLGVSIALKEEDLMPAIKKAINIHPGEQQPALIEEKIEGMEFSCITLFEKNGTPVLLPPTEVVHEAGTHFHDYDQKYMPGRALKFTPARTSTKNLKAIQEACLKTAQILEFKTISRVDGFLKKDGTVVIVDPNSLSGMSPSSFLFNQAAENNMSHTDLINHLIAVELSHIKSLSMNHKQIKSDNKKIKVAVLLGGDTNEKEVSLDSGRNICYKLSPEKYDVIPIFVDKKYELYPLTKKLLVHNATAEIEHELDRSTKINWHDLPNICDFVFIGLHGGRGENGSVQGTLEMLGLPYNGSSIMASSLCNDKYKTNTLLKQNGFDVPQNFLLTKEEWTLNKKEATQKIIDTIPLPLIVKPHNDGCSAGVELIKKEAVLKSCLENKLKQFDTIMIEECIVGMELTIGVIGNEKPQALPPSQTVVAKDILSIEEKFLPGAGENQTPARISQEATKLVQKTMEDVYKTVGCSGYARIDCFYQNAQTSPTKKERVVIIEINTLPGMTPATCIFHQAAEIGIKPMDFIDLIVTFGLEKQSNPLSTKRSQSCVSQPKQVSLQEPHSQS